MRMMVGLGIWHPAVLVALRPWALNDQGIRCIIAPSFADIFFNKCAWLRNTLGRCVVALRRVPKLGLRSVSSLRGRVENAKRNLIDSYWPSIVNGWHDLIMAMQMLRHNHNAHLISVWNCWSVNIQVTDTTKLQNKTIIFLWGFGNLMRDMGLQLFPLRQLLQEWHAADCRHQGAGRDVSLMKYSESLTSGCGWRALDTCRGPELKDCILIILHWRFASADLRFCRLPVSGETRGEEADYCRFGPTRD